MATTLHEATKAGNVDQLKRFLDSKANNVDVNIKDESDERTALHWAARSGRIEVVKLLVKQPGIDLNATDKQGRTPVMLAAFSGYDEILQRLLIKGAAVKSTDTEGKTALHLAVNLIWKSPDISRRTVQLLLAYGANPYAEDNGGKTPSKIVDRLESGTTHLRMLGLEVEAYHHPRRIIICCDGTWNDRETKQPITNVTKILGCVEEGSYCIGEDGGEFRHRQSLHYIDGIGTGTTWLGQRIDGAFGTTISRKICEAYRIICEAYSCVNDQIVLIGFSRGAYTTLCLAHFINDVGLIDRSWISRDLPKLFETWSTGYHIKEPESDRGRLLQAVIDDLVNEGHLRRKITINALAVWDTVASLRNQWPWSIRRPFSWAEEPLHFVGSHIPPCVVKVYHALALGEKRRDFRPVVFTGLPGTIRQCWFLGSHGDVGGGCDNSGLANFSLSWMISKLSTDISFNEQAVLRILRNVSTGPVDPTEVSLSAYDSFTMWWWFRGSDPRRPTETLSEDNIKMHFTVQSFQKANPNSKVIPPLHKLKFLGGRNRLWRSDAGDIKEEKIGPVEFELLEGWLKHARLEGEEKIRAAIADHAPINENEWSSPVLADYVSKAQRKQWCIDSGFWKAATAEEAGEASAAAAENT